MHRRLALVAFTLLVAGCSSGGGSGSAVPTTPTNTNNGTAAQTTGTANAQVSIVIPAPPTTAAFRRSQYISSSTQSMSFAATNGTPVVVPLTPGSPGCTTANSGTTCTVNVPLPIGANQQFVVATFANTAGTGTPLATNKITASVVAGQANPISVSLGGVPASVAISAPATPIPSVAATSVPLTVNVKDSAGNTIVGNNSFSDANGNPVTITLANSDTTGATTLTPATLTAPGTATLAYDNYFQPTTITLSASASTMTTSTTQLAFAAKPIIFAYAAGAFTDTGNPITFGNNTGIESRSRRGGASARRQIQSVTTGVQVLGDLLPTTSTSAPYSLSTHTSSSSNEFAMLNDEILDFGTGVYQQTTSMGIATAPNGHAYISAWLEQQPGIFDAGTTPAWPSGSSIIAKAIGPIALGPGGKMYAAISGGFEQINPATGAFIGAAVTVPGSFVTSVPTAIAVGKDGTVYIEAMDTATGGDNVLAFTSTAAGFTFGHSFTTANAHVPNDGVPLDAIFGIGVDTSNNVYISTDGSGTIDIVPASSQGEVVPARVISNFNNEQDGVNVLIDRAGNIIWAAWSTVSIYAPGAGSVPPPGTTPTTPWVPATDTTAIQTLTDSVDEGNDAFLLLSFGPGS